MSTITPCLWFNGDAEEAVDFYTAAFADSAVHETSRYPTEGLADFQKDMADKVLTIGFEVTGQRFLAINAGKRFAFNESTSFMVNFDPSIDPDGEPRPKIIPALLFGHHVQNRAREAAEYYASVFENSLLATDVRYSHHTGPAVIGSVMFSDFRLRDQWFVAMDAATRQHVTFTESVSFVVECANQAEIDRYWAALSAVPEAEACGWCKDKFGVSWQATPRKYGRAHETTHGIRAPHGDEEARDRQVLGRALAYHA